MSDLHRALIHLFPDYQDGDWEVVKNKGEQEKIGEWNRAEPEPNHGQLQAVTPQQASFARREYNFKQAMKFDSKREITLLTWIANKHGLTLAEAQDELRLIWSSL